MEADLQRHEVVSREQWEAARKVLLAKEKELTRARDALARERRALPWVKVDKDYRFTTETGQVGLADLFAGRSQLLIYHFMFGPDFAAGCPSCSLIADGFNGIHVHLANHDVTLTAVSLASLDKLVAFKRRMGWRFTWMSSNGSDFNRDYHVSFTPEELAKGKVYYNYEMTEGRIDELPGLSVFYKDAAGDIFHTYSTYARGNEHLLGAYAWLDLTPKGRNETSSLMDWVRHHDRYEDSGERAASCCD